LELVAALKLIGPSEPAQCVGDRFGACVAEEHLELALCPVERVVPYHSECHQMVDGLFSCLAGLVFLVSQALEEAGNFLAPYGTG